MKTLVAIILPPVAVLFTGRPLSALLNILLTACFWIPGVIHALIVQSSDTNERRHAEMMSAVSGKTVKPRVSGERQLFTALAVLILLLAAASVVAQRISPSSPVVEAQAVSPAQVGETYQAIVSRHGEALQKDRATGWASWATFKGLFKDGKLVEVSDAP